MNGNMCNSCLEKGELSYVDIFSLEKDVLKYSSSNVGEEKFIHKLWLIREYN